MVGKDGFEIGKWVENFNKKHKAKLLGKNVVYSTKKSAKGSIKRWAGLEALKDKTLVMKVDQSKLKDFITNVYGIKYPELVQEPDLDAGPKSQRQANPDELPGFGIQPKDQSQPEPNFEPKAESPEQPNGQLRGSRTAPIGKTEVDPEMSPGIESAHRTDLLYPGECKDTVGQLLRNPSNNQSLTNTSRTGTLDPKNQTIRTQSFAQHNALDNTMDITRNHTDANQISFGEGHPNTPEKFNNSSR
jgi:hypothetical protein